MRKRASRDSSPETSPEDVIYHLVGKTALVTGAGSGIGRASALRLARAGAQVAILGRTPSELKDTFEEMGGKEQGHLILKADVSSEAQMKEAYGALSKKWKHLDIILANAGINGVWAPLDKLKVSEWDMTLGINLRGTFLTLKLALPLLRVRGGSVIVISSVNGNRIFSNTGATAYSCSKAAQVAFTKMTALELAADKIRVNAICPGAIKTEIGDSTTKRGLKGVAIKVKYPKGKDIPLTDGKPGSADQVGQLVSFLASDASSHITGTEIYIEGAQSLLQG